MHTTFDVPILDKFIDVNDEHNAIISYIVITCEVLKLDRLISVISEQLKNINSQLFISSSKISLTKLSV